MTTFHLLRQNLLQELRAFLDPIEAQQEARRWFEDGLDCSSAWMAQHGGEIAPLSVQRQVDAWLTRRRQGEPWPMILGWTRFGGRRFLVRAGVLVPQAESEAVVGIAQEVGAALRVSRCVDVGAGAGNIGLTLALETTWELTLTEIDPQALDLARANGASLGVAANYVLGDLLEPVPDPIELVVANMPFVDDRAAAELAEAFVFEPSIAMVAPDGGIGLSTGLLQQARARGAWACVIEIGAGQGRRLVDRAEDQGWKQVEVRQDARGQDRAIIVQAER